MATEGLTVQEITDRGAIESVWVRFWNVYVKIDSIPAVKRDALLGPLAVDPIKSQVINASAEYDRRDMAIMGL